MGPQPHYTRLFPHLPFGEVGGEKEGPYSMLFAACGAHSAPFRYRAGGPIPRVLAEQAPSLVFRGFRPLKTVTKSAVRTAFRLGPLALTVYVILVRTHQYYLVIG